MQYELLNAPSLEGTDCLVIGLLKDMPIPSEYESLNSALDGLLDRLQSQLQTPGDIRLQADIHGKALLLILCSDDDVALNKHLHHALQMVRSQKFEQATFAFPRLKHYTADRQLELMVQHLDAGCYALHQFKSKPQPAALKKIGLFLSQATPEALNHGQAIANAISLTKTLADLPANICTPRYLAEQASKLAESFTTVSCKVFEAKEIADMKMNALLSVAQGSIEPPRFIDIQYKGETTQAPVVLVGKGVTFDAGGISIKPAANMHEMKYDMAGAAAVLGIIQACALMKLPIHVIGLIPSAENLPSGTAVKPGDIITSMSQQTIEILNTDAEGRLLLADALTYAERFNPQYVIDIATLTGAVIVALGHVMTGLMSPDDELSKQLLEAAERAQDKTWRLPLDPAYDAALDSPLADMINADFDRGAGSITAGMFLSKFAKAYRWAHLDVAGTAWVSGKHRTATGRPVPLLVEFLRHVAKS